MFICFVVPSLTVTVHWQRRLWSQMILILRWFIIHKQRLYFFHKHGMSVLKIISFCCSSLTENAFAAFFTSSYRCGCRWGGECLCWSSEFHQITEVEQVSLGLHHHICGLSGPFQVLCNGDAKKIKLTDLLSWGSVDVNGCTISAWLLEVHNQLFGVVDIEGNVVILTAPCQTADLDYISSVFIHDDDESSVASSTYFVKTLELGLALQSRLYRKQRSRLMQCNWV